MFLRREEVRKNNKSPWKVVDQKPNYDDKHFTYGAIRMDRPRAKKDGDSYRVYSEHTKNKLNSRPKTIITTNKYSPNERVVYTRVSRRKGGKS